MKGFKTFFYGLAIALLSPLLAYLESIKAGLGECGVDPVTNAEICSLPWWVGTAIGLGIIGLRALTNSSMFKEV